jgi:heme-degrading monooxygenase HmoA
MEKKFVAINYITCESDYRQRFEELFASRAHAIDRMPGFVDMQVSAP